jgi:hypothetical protein
MQAWHRFISSLHPHAPEPAPRQESVGELRQRTLALLDDCSGAACERLRQRLQAARCANDLWLARSEIFQQVACQHCEQQAASRINDLLPAFEGWVPQKLLMPI